MAKGAKGLWKQEGMRKEEGNKDANGKEGLEERRERECRPIGCDALIEQRVAKKKEQAVERENTS